MIKKGKGTFCNLKSAVPQIDEEHKGAIKSNLRSKIIITDNDREEFIEKMKKILVFGRNKSEQ